MIARGAYLHDIGKVAIPDSILNKPGKLTPAETATMREHAYRGYELIGKIPFLGDAAQIVYSHQEWFDGSGYPRGLRGEEIPLGARIFSIADTLDAITSKRVYRGERSYEVAREEIIRCSGTQFDPQIVRIFVEMPDAIWDDLRRNISGSSLTTTTPTPMAKDRSASI
jgi:HD-GYP domain-containing protein (c-di-GMP phosphodiesterase class II)